MVVVDGWFRVFKNRSVELYSQYGWFDGNHSPVSLAKEIIFPLIGQIRSMRESELVYYKESVDPRWLLAGLVVTELNSLYNFHHQLQHTASNINHSPESILFSHLCPSVWSTKKHPAQGKLIHHTKLQYFVIRSTGRLDWLVFWTWSDPNWQELNYLP